MNSASTVKSAHLQIYSILPGWISIKPYSAIYCVCVCKINISFLWEYIFVDLSSTFLDVTFNVCVLIV